MTDRDFLDETLRRYSHLPSYALWRAIKLYHLSQLDFPEPILDLACGNGEFGEMLLGRERSVYGLDLDRTFLTQARRLAAHRGLVQGDANRLPFREACFGSVLCNCALEHIPEDRAAVREMARVLQPGGRLVFTVPGPRFHEGLYTYQRLLSRGEQEQAAAYLAETDRRLAHYHYRTETEWREIVEAAGLQVERVQPYLTGAALAMWDRLENYWHQPVMNVLNHKKLAALILLPRSLREALIRRVLHASYRREREPADLYGCWLVVARKPASNSLQFPE